MIVVAHMLSDEDQVDANAELRCAERRGGAGDDDGCLVPIMLPRAGAGNPIAGWTQPWLTSDPSGV